MPLSQGWFASLGPTGGLSVLYGLGANGPADDPSDNLHQGFFTLPSGPFADMAVAI